MPRKKPYRKDIEYIRVPRLVAQVCLDILLRQASAQTVQACLSADPELWKRYDVLRMIGNANPSQVNDLLTEALPLIAEVFERNLPSSPDSRHHNGETP